MAPALLVLLLAFAQAQQAAPAAIPNPPGSWRIQLTTNGGFGGDGSSFTADSRGSLKCSGTAHTCPEKLSATTLRNLDQRVKTATAHPWAIPVPGNFLCSDCASTSVEIRFRMTDGSVQTFTTSWDVTNKSSVVSAVLQIVDTLSALGR